MIVILQGSASTYDQRTIDDAPVEDLERIIAAVDYKDALHQLVQLANDEAFDEVNNFHSIREVPYD